LEVFQNSKRMVVSGHYLSMHINFSFIASEPDPFLDYMASTFLPSSHSLPFPCVDNTILPLDSNCCFISFRKYTNNPNPEHIGSSQQWCVGYSFGVLMHAGGLTGAVLWRWSID
jgi:hypothetical protein